MLSGTSYLLSPHYWALSRVPANTETFPVSGLGGMGQGELFMLAVPKQLGAGSGPQESEPCCCSSSLLTHGTTTTCPHQCPARGMSLCCRCESPSKGRPRLWSL